VNRLRAHLRVLGTAIGILIGSGALLTIVWWFTV
jgi:uncharacterized membrane protein YccC